MPQPTALEPITRLNLCLPESLRKRLDKHLYHPGQMRIPKGAYQQLIIQLLEEHLARRSK